MINKIEQEDEGKTIKGNGNTPCQLNIIRKLHLLLIIVTNPGYAALCTW